MFRHSLRSVLLISLAASTALAAVESAPPLVEEQRAVDEAIAKSDAVELRKLTPRIFRLAHELLKAKGDAAARPYLERGLQSDSWALPEQLTLAEILERAGEHEAAREKAQMVLRVGEEDALLRRASRFLKESVPELPRRLSEIQEKTPTLVLAPVGSPSLFLLGDLREALSQRLGIDVQVALLDLVVPAPDRTFRTQWIARTREQLIKTAKEQPEFAARLGEMDVTLASLQADDEAVVNAVRTVVLKEQGEAGVKALEAMLAQYANFPQWSADRMLAMMQTALAGRAQANLWVLGVTSHDLCAPTANFLFGSAATGRFFGVISTQRFRADFNGEPPKRERLTERLLKQSLSSITYMVGIDRCTTPECAHAYPQSLAEHDQKPSTLCAVCRKALEQKIGRALPK